MAGTPAYVAPEQHLLRPADARAEPVSPAACRCTGHSAGPAPVRRRRAGGSFYGNVVAGASARAAPRRRRPGAHPRACFGAGLARPDPAARRLRSRRWSTTLERDARAPAYRALVALALASRRAVWPRSACDPRDRRPPPCRGSGAGTGGASGTWPQKLEALADRVRTDPGRGHAEDTFQRARGGHGSSGYAGDDRRPRAPTPARRPRFRHEQSPALLNLRMACLDGRRGALAGPWQARPPAPTGRVMDKADGRRRHDLPSLASCARRRGAHRHRPAPRNREVRAPGGRPPAPVSTPSRGCFCPAATRRVWRWPGRSPPRR